MNTQEANALSSINNFRFDTRDVDWKKFITNGCCYKLLAVDEAKQTADMIVKFEAGARCIYHRHVAPATSLVLEGDLHVIAKTDDGETLRSVKPAGMFTTGVEDDVHVEAGGENGVIVYFSLRGSSNHVYDLLDTDLNLKRAITLQDSAKDLAYWER